MRRWIGVGLLCAAAAWGHTPLLPPDYEQQLAALEQARRAKPGDAGVLDALAGSYAMGGRHAQAAEVMRDLIKAVAGDPERRPAVRLRLARNLAWSAQMASAITLSTLE